MNRKQRERKSDRTRRNRLALVANHRSFTVDLATGQYGRYHVAFRERGVVVGRATVTPVPAAARVRPASTNLDARVQSAATVTELDVQEASR